MALQKPIFLLYYGREAMQAAADWWRVIWHGLSLDISVAGYVTALPLLLMLLWLWVPPRPRTGRWILTGYFVVVSVVAAVLFSVNLALYEHWGFPLDSTVLIYLDDPKEVAASAGFWLFVRQTLLAAAYAALMIWTYRRTMRLLEPHPARHKSSAARTSHASHASRSSRTAHSARASRSSRLPLPSRFAAAVCSVVLLLLGGLDFLAIRGGVSQSVANVSHVSFSPNLFLNHAATNPVFSFMASLGHSSDYAEDYAFFDDASRVANFETLRGNGPAPGAPERILKTARPNVVVVILESFARTIMDETLDGEPVMPNMQRLKEEGVWFENFYANSFRTDRGEVAILSGFPAQTRMSIMKLPSKVRSLPSLARSLGDEGYGSVFAYGGDLNFTDQTSYMYATGWQELVWQKHLNFDAPASDWGWDDSLMCGWFADRVMALDGTGKPFLAGLLTLSSHQPFEVPFAKFDDKMLNSMAFADDCVGRMIDRLKASPAWDDLLVVLVADHGFPYPRSLAYNVPERHHIPMIWTGGAIAKPLVVDTYGSQIDICATILGQMELPHHDYDYSKDLFAPSPPRKFAYYTFNEGFGVVDASGSVIWDAASGTATASTPDEASGRDLLDVGRTMLQTTYVDIGRR